MSYGVAIWEGNSPQDEKAATKEFDAHYKQLQLREPPTLGIRLFVDALLARYSDLAEVPNHKVDKSPWADGPLIDNAAGSFIYLALVHSMAAEILPFVTETARAHGLVAFDPQTGELLTA